METVWQRRVESAVKKAILCSVFAGFNTNVDAVVHCNGTSIASLLQDPDVSLDAANALDVSQIETIREKNEFVAVLKDALGKGKSFYIILENLELLDWLDQVFANRQELMGGQAGIIANQMAALEAKTIAYTSLLSKKQASLFFPEVLYPVFEEDLQLIPVHQAYNPEDQLKINWIFEYAKGIEFDFGGEKIVTPRANRVILATRPPGVVMGFAGEIHEHLPELGSKINVGFLAGYHYAPSEEPDLTEYLNEITNSIRMLRSGNPNVHLHYEYVPMKDQEDEKRVLTTISREFDSFGINENEIRRVLEGFGYLEERRDIDENERAFSLYRGALRLMGQLHFSRFHIHNLGYYVLMLKKPYPVAPEVVRDCCLFGSSVNAIKAKYGGYVIKDQLPEAVEFGLSDLGLRQLRLFYEEAKALGLDIPDYFCEEGIWDHDDCYVLVVPAHVIPNPVSTVGMGDTISSSCYASEYSSVLASR
ncbi:MAG: hypothetical protein GX228_08320 [Firmicutes bacterium]|nr:ADP-dependent glucokinase/phosphofructokinase [Bacillota bacterium]NLL88916.1 hypothetical protein [Bacillota bacterium]HKM18249.1 ADP-dependent glucokinase/phosphofructokinase [Limnochordia bacterium]